ncbi:MAG: zinc ribbon domain-containing protein [Chloroflexi bacterium CFX4]|nr:zinc ribbon domain-containing protein [Chloroflexi bacterium CFX4]MDL1924079.1 zinc ribbon domain-containing protein [Chloroflexi bacterium CFX3]
MPRYDYRCLVCEVVFEAKHGFDDPPPPCPNGHSEVQRLITTTPRLLKGMAALASRSASKEELQAKWAEETPKLRKKLVEKLGEETVRKHGSTLGRADD